MTPKLPADLMALAWKRFHVGGLASGEVECWRCWQIYRLGEKHTCPVSR